MRVQGWGRLELYVIRGGAAVGSGRRGLGAGLARASCEQRLRPPQRHNGVMLAGSGEGLGKWDAVAVAEAVDTSEERKEGFGFFSKLAVLLPHCRR